jgi:hypothetical protein
VLTLAGTASAARSKLEKVGRAVASRLFRQRKTLEKPDSTSAVAAFGSIVTDLITWSAEQTLVALPRSN